MYYIVFLNVNNNTNMYSSCLTVEWKKYGFKSILVSVCLIRSLSFDVIFLFLYFIEALM